jgi:cellulose 1,4-beta-cellobiosidase
VCADAVKFELVTLAPPPVVPPPPEPPPPPPPPPPPADITAPGAPSELLAQITGQAISLDWADNLEADLHHYSVYRSLTSGDNYVLLRNDLTTSAFVDSTAVQSVTYYYVATATDAAGNTSDASLEVMAQVPAPDQPPAAPMGLAAVPGLGSISLDWNDNAEADFNSYEVYRSTTSGSGYSLLKSGLLVSAYDDAAVTQGTTYYYVVTTVDDAGNTSTASSEVASTPINPNVPLTLAWNRPTVNKDGTPLNDLGGFKLYIGTNTRTYTSVIDVGNATQYTLSNMAPGTYFFCTSSYDQLRNESAFSTEITKMIP